MNNHENRSDVKKCIVKNNRKVNMYNIYIYQNMYQYDSINHHDL